MLTQVFWLKDTANTSEATSQEVEMMGLKALPHVALQEVSSWDILLKELEEWVPEHQETPLVVFYLDSPENVSISLGKLKLLAPMAAFLVKLTGDEDLDNALFALDCDFILPKTSSFEIHHRIQQAVRLSELRKMMSSSGQMDEVTTLYNRRYFMERLNSEISLAKRHAVALSLVVIRISFFQVYVDSYGYEFILDLLKHVSGIVSRQLRQEDIVARLGDDEIALILPRCPEDGAKTLTERIMESCVSEPYYPFGRTDEESEEISAYAGIVSYPLQDEEIQDADSMLRYARHAVHQARCSSEGLVLAFSEIQPAL